MITIFIKFQLYLYSYLSIDEYVTNSRDGITGQLTSTLLFRIIDSIHLPSKATSGHAVNLLLALQKRTDRMREAFFTMSSIDIPNGAKKLMCSSRSIQATVRGASVSSYKVNLKSLLITGKLTRNVTLLFEKETSSV